MPKSATVVMLTGFLIVLLAVPAISQMSMGTQGGVADEPEDAMVSGVLAHDMNESQATLLSKNGFYVEADVELGENSSWQTIYKLCKQYNISLIGKFLHNTMNGSKSTPDSAEWAQTIQTAVTNYGDIVKYWEIWNEPTDSDNFFNGTASEYTEMLRIANQTIKSISPDAVVIGLGGLHLNSGSEGWVEKGFDFARNVTALGGMEYCDAISLHAYPWANYTAQVGDTMVQSLAEYRNITHNEPIWITETGQHSSTKGFDEKDQAGFLYNSYKLMKNQNVSAFIWYELGETADNLSKNDSFGLFDVNSNPKPAFQTYVMVKSETATVKAAVDYLAKSFNSDIGLIYETPDNNGATYHIYSDNYLAELALAPYASNGTIKDILRFIGTTSNNLIKTQPGIVNQYQILNDSAFVLPIRNASNCLITEWNGLMVNCTVNNGTGTLAAKDYADIAFLEAIAYHNNNQTENAMLVYNIGAAMWNGVGFNDTVYRSYTDGRGYDTFKVALYIYASKALNCSFDVRAYSNLLSCQLSSGVSGAGNKGGFATYYTANNCTNNQTNTETTALAVLALTYASVEEPVITSPTSTPTPTPKATPSPSPTPTPTATPTPTPTPTPTTTPTPTSTPTTTPTSIPTPTQTPTPTPKPATPTPTPTASPTPQTATPTPTSQPTSFIANPLFYIAVGTSAAGLVVVGCLFLFKRNAGSPKSR